MKLDRNNKTEIRKKVNSWSKNDKSLSRVFRPKQSMKYYFNKQFNKERLNLFFFVSFYFLILLFCEGKFSNSNFFTFSKFQLNFSFQI